MPKNTYFQPVLVKTGSKQFKKTHFLTQFARGNANANPNANANADPNANANPNANSNTNAYANPNANANDDLT